MKDIYVDLRTQNKSMREAFKNKDLVSVYDLLDKIEDLVFELEAVKEEYEDFKKDVEDNYKYMPIDEQAGISDRDFI